MALVKGSCQCIEEGCECENKHDADAWVDALTSKCRECEVDHGQRWGHHGAKVQEATQGPGEHNI